MSTQDKFKDYSKQQYHEEQLCLVEDQGKYIHVDWLIEDFNPDQDSYETEFGDCPKQLVDIDNTFYIKADCSIISKS